MNINDIILNETNRKVPSNNSIELRCFLAKYSEDRNFFLDEFCTCIRFDYAKNPVHQEIVSPTEFQLHICARLEAYSNAI